jgi:hypothetical protein
MIRGRAAPAGVIGAGAPAGVIRAGAPARVIRGGRARHSDRIRGIQDYSAGHQDIAEGAALP